MLVSVVCGGQGVKRLATMIAALAILAEAASSARAENLPPRAFTETVAAAATAALPDAKVTVASDLHLETRSAAGEATTTDLRNAYQLYMHDPARLDELIRRHVAVLAATVRLGDARTAPDPLRIVPILKSQRWLEGVRQARRAKENGPPEPLAEPFNTELTIVYAEDRATSLRYLTTRDDTGDRVKLHDLALANLHRLLPKIEMRPGADGIFLISTGGDYEASLLLADSLWSSGQIKVDGDIVVAVPAKDVLLLAGSRNQAGIARLRALAADLATGPYALTPVLFVYRGGKFVAFDDK
jgi:hypothetical protein